MLSLEIIKELIAICQELGKLGLKNGISAEIPKLNIDIVKPPLDFLGVDKNPAIFVNQRTYNLLGKKHKNWVLNKTIAIKDSLLNQSNLEVIGAIVHELGHAFNVAAHIPNTEANAYIFEIEIVKKLVSMNYNLLSNCSTNDLGVYFKSRLPYYKKGMASNSYLGNLVSLFNHEFKLETPVAYSLPKLQSSRSMFNQINFFILKPPKAPTLLSLNSMRLLTI